MARSIILISLFVLINFGAKELYATPLDDYVNAPDPHYSYSLLKLYEMPGYKIYVLNMTSQKWLDETVTTKPIWYFFI